MYKMLKIVDLLVAVIILKYAALVRCDKVQEVELANNWTLKNQNRSIAINIAKIPSGVYTALSGLFGDVLDSTNDVNLRWIAYDNWTYSKSFKVNQDDFKHIRSVNLTLHGIDTVATVRLNDVVIGETNNMFVRYSYDVLRYLRQENVLEIEITSPVWAAKQLADMLSAKGANTPPNCEAQQMRGECHRNMLRKMQMSFGSEFGLAAPSMGIWKTVTLEYFEVAILRDIDVAVHRNDTHWTMDIQVFLSTGIRQTFHGDLSFYAPTLLDENPIVIKKRDISYISPVIKFKVILRKEKVKLWWPNGYGSQKLYPLFFTFNSWLSESTPNVQSKSISQKSLEIGFRTVELVEDFDEYGRSFYFKVNGYPIFIKGANYVPSHILPELSTDQDRIKHILESARDSHLNLIRVWGGGLYQSDYFYSMADFYGLLIWQDMAFTKSTYPMTDDFVESVRIEVAHNAKRIAYHPSLALIVTNDEIELFLVKNRTELGHDADRLEAEYKQLFMGTIKHELNIISRSEYSPRPGPMMSTPSNGIKENTIADPQSPNFGDIHFYEEEKDGWNADIYPHARFISQYGFQSLPTMSSWNRSLGKDDTILELIKHRQHSPSGFKPTMQLIERHLNFVENLTDNVEALIYFSQVVQAMGTKIATQVFRSQRANNRTMGALYWQLNDVWIAPSWSSIDFYGNYKLLYYWSKDFLAPISIIALYDEAHKMINVTLTRDEITETRDPRVYTVTINTYLWSELYPKKTITREEILESNSVQQRFIPLDTVIPKPFNRTNCFLEFVLSDSDKQILSSTFYFPSAISKTVGISDPYLSVDITWRYCNEDTSSVMRVTSYSITVRVQHPALFVYIEIAHPLIEKYKLSHNGFLQVVPVKIIHLEYEHASQCVTITNDNIKVLTINQYMQKAIKVNVTNTSATKNDAAGKKKP